MGSTGDQHCSHEKTEEQKRAILVSLIFFIGTNSILGGRALRPNHLLKSPCLKIFPDAMICIFGLSPKFICGFIISSALKGGREDQEPYKTAHSALQPCEDMASRPVRPSLDVEPTNASILGVSSLRNCKK